MTTTRPTPEWQTPTADTVSDQPDLDLAETDHVIREAQNDSDFALLEGIAFRLRAEVERLRARIGAAHDALSRLDIDEESCHTLESTVEAVVRSWRVIAESEGQAADQVERLRAELATMRDSALMYSAMVGEHRQITEAEQAVIAVARLVVEHQRAGVPAGPGWEARRDELWSAFVAAVDALPVPGEPEVAK